MKRLVILALVGFAAQLVDGSLGMGFGVTSTSLLLIAGLTPAMASASVHLAELGTNVASGFSHWKLGNVDWRLVARLGVPGALGAFGGATFLSQISTTAAKPVMAAILGALGMYILLRYAIRPPAVAQARTSPHTAKFLVPLGLAGGFVDATGGGGWGPVATTSLLSAGKTAPRTVIGSVDTSEFMVSFAASLGFVVNLGLLGIDWRIVVALLLGGLVAAPIAAWLVSRIPAQIMGVAVGGIIIMTNLKTLFDASQLSSEQITVGFTVFAAVWVAMTAWTAWRYERRRRAEIAAKEASEMEWSI
ncbi:sulfite exporter TauE/SafE family protein [Tessaracoccus caeni]|uniref:sulfite exporter TauE/SafE family protein n=1 Tax=Tessaracoccus caeni TaxID=3031239 RepID=UPI0023DB772E|nr:sulfite exporter TauE/SafE family protein [Tessaracoccus caeni]MDF1487465.1 sulfite exporter TauE/SafE family protein [Tessaracoccus caeni]